MFLKTIKSQKRKRARKGSVLYFSLVIMAVIMSIVLGLTVILRTQIRTIRNIQFSVPALYLADIGIEEALYNMAQDDSTESFNGEVSNFGNYEVKIVTKDDDPEGTCQNDYCVRSVGIYRGIRRAIETSFDIAKEQSSSREEAQLYCQNYPGVTTLNGDVVYCDQYNNMWAPTLPERYLWSNETKDIITEYGASSGDCNEIPTGHLNKYPACEACADLSYAGLTGWRLPAHTSFGGSPYCFVNSQLWKHGEELCSNWDCSLFSGACKPGWEGAAAQADNYWSAIQSSNTNAWCVNFSNANAGNRNKNSDPICVRCFLGEWIDPSTI